jgi:hypothetical protein
VRVSLGDLNGWWKVLEEKRRNPASRWIRWNYEEVSGEGESQRSEWTVESPRGEMSKPHKPLDKVELRGG